MSFKPTTFGRYALLKRIAIGGMAEVFRAMSYGAEGFEKLVAIKRMLPHMSRDAQFLDMFINEAKLAALLSHSNIVQIYDFGSIDKQLYLAMEYVRGQDLAHIIFRLRESGFAAPIELVCYLLIQVLHGLQYAHQPRSRGGRKLRLVHRDISPPNIIVSYSGEVKLADFGIAKALRETSNTGTGILKGKYCYMSPEQAGGGQLDHRTDLFSLGICFYELLTLEDMFPGNSELEILERVRAADFIEPRKVNPAIPRKLEAILLRTLRRDPKERYANAAEFRDAVEKFLIEKNYRFSANWLADFMRDIFGDEIDKDQEELDAEAEEAERMRPEPERLAAIEAEMEQEVETLTHQRPALWDIDTGSSEEEDDERKDSETSTIMVDRGALGLEDVGHSTIATSDNEATLEEDAVSSAAYSVRIDQPTDKDLRPLGANAEQPPLDAPSEDAAPTYPPPAEPEPDESGGQAPEDWFDSSEDGEPGDVASPPAPADLIGLEDVALPAPPAEPIADPVADPVAGFELDEQPEKKKRDFPFGLLFLFLLLAVGAVIVFAFDPFRIISDSASSEGGTETMTPLGEPASPPDGGTGAKVASANVAAGSVDAGAVEQEKAEGQEVAGGQDGGTGQGDLPAEVASAQQTVADGGQQAKDEAGSEKEEAGTIGGDAKKADPTLAAKQVEVEADAKTADTVDKADAKKPDKAAAKVVAKHDKRKPAKAVRAKKRRKKTTRRRRRLLPRKHVKTARRRRTTSRAKRRRKKRPKGVPRDLGGPPYLFVDGNRVKSTRALSRRLDPGVHTLELRDAQGRIVRKWQVRVSAD